MEDIRILFVLPDTVNDIQQCTTIMQEAFEICEQNAMNVTCVRNDEFSSTDLTKKDFVVFEQFSGKTFETLKSSQSPCSILGASCVLICLREGISIPNFPWPIYNVAMIGCFVSCSHLSKDKKLGIKEKVQLMGGAFMDDFTTKVTHLVTDTVKSTKYSVAANQDTKIMLAEWVNAVWKASQTDNIHANDEQFKQYSCLPFHNLTICATGLVSEPELRKTLAKNVVQNGGVFTGNLPRNRTDFLVVYGEKGKSSEKFRAAQESNICCVTLEWINDSIAKGYALPPDDYLVKKIAETSTPNKEDRMCPNFSIFSAIGDTTTMANRQSIDETCVTRKISKNPADESKRVSPPNKRKGSTDYQSLVDGLDVKKAKLAGQYLDSCSVYMVGFTGEEREKLCKILNLSGATRYDQISDRLTHIIVGNPLCPEMKIIRSKNTQASVVSVSWLLQCIEKQRAVDEEEHLMSLHETSDNKFSSPLTRKGLSLLLSQRTITSEELDLNDPDMGELEPEKEMEIMQQYLNFTKPAENTDTFARMLQEVASEFLTENMNTATTSNIQSKPTMEEQASCSEQQSLNFEGRTFLLCNFPDENSDYVKEQVESALGTVVPNNYKGIPDYVVTPMFINEKVQCSAGLETVSELWVLHSVKEDALQPIEYYHRPIIVTNSKPLENCVITASGYLNYEKIFLKSLIQEMGGILQEQLARVTSEKKGVLGSTHLVSLETKGKKYEAALKWGLPVIHKEWLLECAKQGALVSESEFLMGASKAPVRRQLSSTPRADRKSTMKENTFRNVTPASKEPLNISKVALDKTPVNQRLFQLGRGSDENSPCSQVTPVNKIMAEVRKTNLLGTPITPQLPEILQKLKTPESPFGAGIKPHMSPRSKKELFRYIHSFPEFKPPPSNSERRQSTPLSEVKRRCWERLLAPNKEATVVNENENPARVNLSFSADDGCEEIAPDCAAPPGKDTESMLMDNKLRLLEDLIEANGSGRRNSRAFSSTIATQVGTSESRESQPFTVKWDHRESGQAAETSRVFIISGIENDLRQTIIDKLERLGAQVSQLSTYDPLCTHMICPKPGRNEKTLSCMAGGKWILHTSYVDKSTEAGRLLDEEQFEFGNPRFRPDIRLKLDKESQGRLEAVYWWRKEIARRGYKAFNDMRAIVVANKKDPIIRVIEAGGGTVVDAKPPFQKAVHATLCLLEPRSVTDFSLYNSLAQQGIYCVNTLYINDFLYRVNKDVRDMILPQFSHFY